MITKALVLVIKGLFNAKTAKNLIVSMKLIVLPKKKRNRLLKTNRPLRSIYTNLLKQKLELILNTNLSGSIAISIIAKKRY